MPLTIPTTNVAPTRSEPRTIATYGPEKVGKSTTVAALNAAVPGNLLHIDTHDGVAQLNTRRVCVNTLSEYKELVTAPPGKRNALQEAWHAAPFAFLCMDVLDDLETWALEQANEDYRRMPIGKNFGGASILELDRGLGYGYLRDAFAKLVTPIWGNPLWTTIFLVHQRAKYLDNVILPEASSEQLDLTGKVRRIICNKVDAVGHWVKDARGALSLDFRTKEGVICAARYPHLHNAVVPFSYPPKPEEWAKVWPVGWNKAASLPAPPVPVTAAPQPNSVPQGGAK